MWGISYQWPDAVGHLLCHPINDCIPNGHYGPKKCPFCESWIVHRILGAYASWIKSLYVVSPSPPSALIVLSMLMSLFFCLFAESAVKGLCIPLCQKVLCVVDVVLPAKYYHGHPFVHCEYTSVLALS